MAGFGDEKSITDRLERVDASECMTTVDYATFCGVRVIPLSGGLAGLPNGVPVLKRDVPSGFDGIETFHKGIVFYGVSDRIL